MIKISRGIPGENRGRIAFLFLVILTISLLSVPPVTAQVTEHTEVLVILSYHPGMVFSDEEIRGIRESLAPLEDTVDIREEYMDTKEISDEKHFQNLYALYQHKYQNTSIDVIIAADNSAFDFITIYRDNLFPGTPVVFCGINYFSDDMIEGIDNITGVVEDKDIRSTLNTAFVHFPGTKEVYVIHDTTNTGHAIHHQVIQFVPEFENKVNFTFISDVTISELLDKVEVLPEDSIILLEGFNRDAEGKVVTHEELGDLISTHTDTPIYGNTEMYVGHGIIGGKITTGHSQGQVAGGMVLQILNGEPASSIPVVKNSPNVYMFDYNKIMQYEIALSSLPEESIIINQPKQKQVPAWILYVTLVGLASMGIGVVVLVFFLRVRKEIESDLRDNILERKKAQEELVRTNEELKAAYQQLKAQEDELQQNYEELRKTDHELKESESRYRHVVEDQTEFICRFRKDGTIIFANDAFCRYFQKPSHEIIGHKIKPDIPAEYRLMLSEHFAAITPENPVRYTEHRIRMPNGEVRWQQWSDRGIFDEKGEILEYQSVGRDVTDRKNAEETLALARRKLNVLNSVTFNDIRNTLFSLAAYLALATDMEKNEDLKQILQKQESLLAQIGSALTLANTYQDMGIKPPRWQNVNQTFLYAISHMDFEQVSSISRNVYLDGLEIYADPLLENVLSNLTDNVFRHGGPVTRISIFYNEVPDGIMLVFEDDGQGIPLSEKEKIFERQYGESKGLGLYMVREILGITGITISETGEPGKGARFEMFVSKGGYRFNV
ncbi:MAG TPA: ABC transporter substrate binding protein [Methanoregulaceae archaeon]|nr:ABC transporter substrate binding protein [Methanoregulaceae archaeon]